MKKRSFLFGALAALAMMGCSDNEMEKDNGFVVPEDGVVYANISVAMAGNGAGSRALKDEFAVGTEDENKIKSLLLVFYNDNGTVVANSLLDETKLATMDPGTNKKDETGATHMYRGVVQVTLNPAITSTPASVMAYANPQKTNDQPNPLAQIRMAHRSQVTNTDGLFTMNNSVYYDEEGNLVTAQPIKSEFYDSEKEAQDALNAGAAPTVIYLERMAVKTVVIKSTSLDNQAYEVNDAKRLVFDIDKAKWGLTGIEKEMFVVKNLPDTKDEADAMVGTWAYGAFRSYWARSWSYGVGSNSAIHGNLDATFPTTGNDVTEDNALEYLTYDDKRLTTDFGLNSPKYCLENTGRNNKFNQYETATTNVLITGQYRVVNAAGEPVNGFNGEGDNAPTFYYFTNDLYLDDAQNGPNGDLRTAMVRNQTSVYKDNQGTLADVTSFKVTPLNGEAASRYFLQLADNVQNLYFKEGDNYKLIGDGEGQVPVATVNSELKTVVTFAIKYNHGHAFFSVPIEHTGVRNADNTLQTGTYGVVRNHVYQITIKSIKGLAYGVDDDEPLIPTSRDQTKYWVGADIKTLQWHVVTQDVNL